MPLFGPPDISKLKAQKNIKGLSKALTYKRDATVRKNAAIALGELGDPAAIPTLAAAIEDESGFVQKQAVFALGKIGTPDAVKSLTSMLGYPGIGIQNMASEVLSSMGEAVVEALILTVNNGNATAKANAARVLAEIKDQSAVDSLIQVLQDPDPQVRKWSVYALKMIGDSRASPAIAKMIKDKDVKVRDFVISALGELGDSGAAETLVANLSHPDEKIREQTAATLERLNWKPTQDANGAWYWIIKGNWRKCKSIGEPAVEPLLSALKSNNIDTKKTAVITLGNMHEPRALDKLIKLLEVRSFYKGSNEIKPLVCKALERIGGEEAIDALIKAYFASKGMKLQRKVLIALKGLGKPALAKVKRMTTGARQNRLEAIELMTRLEPTATGFEPLLKILTDKKFDEDTFLEAIKAMASLYKSGNLNEKQKQKLLDQEDALHYRVTYQPQHVDQEADCDVHYDYSTKRTDKHTDFYDYI